LDVYDVKVVETVSPFQIYQTFKYPYQTLNALN